MRRHTYYGLISRVAIHAVYSSHASPYFYLPLPYHVHATGARTHARADTQTLTRTHLPVLPRALDPQRRMFPALNSACAHECNVCLQVSVEASGLMGGSRESSVAMSSLVAVLVACQAPAVMGGGVESGGV
jgi:hypothetical protein